MAEMEPGDILRRIREILWGFFTAKATGYVRFERMEAQHLFMILVFSPLVGIPLVPASITLELLPFLEEPMRISLARLDDLDDIWGILGGRFDIE